MPDPAKLLSTLRRAADAFRNDPNRRGRWLELPPDCEVLVAGDMHGNVDNFSRLLKVADLAAHPRRHLVLQEIIHGPFRHPGGGDRSHQMLDLLAALKAAYPHRVHFLLGNHELAQWRGQRIGKGDVDQNDLFRAGVDEAYGAHAEAIYAAYLDLFSLADLVIRTANRVLLTHSLPSARHLPHLDLQRLRQDDFAAEDFSLGGVVHSLVWGRDLRAEHVAAFLARMEADLLVTGHIPCPQGYDLPNDRQLILDALGSPACACLFPTDRPLTLQDLVAGIVRLS